MDRKSSASLHDNTHLVLKYAVISRLVLISLIVLWRSLLSPYDTSASINPSCLSNTTSIISLFSGSNSYSKSDSPPVLLPRLASAIEDSIVWDSVYFVRIAQCGYEYEQTYAFLPLIPICISLLSRTVFAPLIPFIGQRAVLGLSGYMLNNFAFVLAAFYLYRLSAIILKDTEVALRASILFCFNPASIFYSSMGVGFLKYFQVKQLPNFLLASPILSLALCTIIHYVKLWPEVFVSLGFRASSPNKERAASSIPLERGAGSKRMESRSDAGQVIGDSLRWRKSAAREENYVIQSSEDERSENPGFKPVTIVPFILHLVFMAATAFFVMHVQVSTRFLSASPPLYWFGSYVMTSPYLSKRWGYIIWTYCAAYILLGSLLFSNFYPFT